MGSWVDLAALHNPSPGTTPPAAWGDGITNNLELLAGKACAEVTTLENTTSTSYTDLATVGPTVTVDTGTTAIAIVQVQFGLSGAGGIFIGAAVSGASSIAAADANCLYVADAFNNQGAHCALLFFNGTLTAGTNIFTMKYKVSANTGTFLRRRILVIPLF